MMGLKMYEVEMTPALASKHLRKRFKHQRPASPARVSQYADMMRKGKWFKNGETIVLCATGKVLDGVTRLKAVVEADTTVPMLVVEGVAPRHFISLDGGRKRGHSVQAALLGIPFPQQSARAAQVAWKMENSSLFDSQAIPPVVLADFMKKHSKEVAICGEMGDKFRTRGDYIGLVSPGVAAGLYHLMRQHLAGGHITKAKTFMTELQEQKSRNKTVSALIAKLQKQAARNGGFTNRVTSFESAWIMKAFKAYVSGEACPTFRVNDSIMDEVEFAA